MSKEDKMSMLNNTIKNCSLCELCKFEVNKTNSEKNYGKLLGGGYLDASVIFIGCNPSYRRFAETNSAFSGGLGDKFRKILVDAGFDLTKIYITNLLKCSTPSNGEPTNQQIEKCRKFLNSEINIIQPRALVIMGAVAQNAFGLEKCGNETIDVYNRKVFKLYHPNSILSYGRLPVSDYIDVLKKIREKIEVEK